MILCGKSYYEIGSAHCAAYDPAEKTWETIHEGHPDLETRSASVQLLENSFWAPVTEQESNGVTVKDTKLVGYFSVSDLIKLSTIGCSFFCEIPN